MRLGMLVLSLGALAQEFRATLTGRVVDPTGAPVAGGVVRLVSPDPGFPFWVSRTPTVYTNASLPCRI
ncbi:MAG: carboxypeptidase regulatory-like domain-containing protein [Acidobacteria bacterium]|nr:carboxypeptidase regulatory-like domain-containing protein [Acidobacteriota bacterium]